MKTPHLCRDGRLEPAPARAIIAAPLVALAVATAAACSPSRPATSPTARSGGSFGFSPAVAPTQLQPHQAGELTLRSPLPLSGEYIVTANRDDHSLSVVPVGLARVAATVPLDLAPRAVAAAPNSDRAFVLDAARR